MDKALVSAIIPAYNRPRQTQRAIKAVAEQVYHPIELIVVDDGSQPPLRDKLSLPESSVKKVIFKRHEENRGGNYARNTGIKNASGDYLAFLDSDDEWVPEKIQQQVHRLDEKEAQVSYTGVKQVDCNGNINAIKTATRRGDLLGDLLKRNVIGTFSSVVVKNKAVNQVGKPNPDMPCWQDWEWYLRLAAEGLRFDAIEDPLTIRHNEGTQLSGSFTPKRDRAYPMVRSQIKELAPTPEHKHKGLAYLDFQLGYAALTNQRYLEAHRLFFSAIRQHPTDKQFFIFLACAGPHFHLLRKAKRTAIRKIYY